MMATRSANPRRVGQVMTMFIDLPERPYTIIQDRVWNRINKDAMRKALEFHHNNHMPLHFKQSARRRYAHKPRNEKYKAWKKKRFRSLLDLVMTGGTRDKITAANGYDRLTVGGAAVGGQKGLVGKLHYTFGFNDKLRAHYLAHKVRFRYDPASIHQKQSRLEGRKPAATNRVSLSDMRRELMAMTPDEVAAIRDVYRKAVMDAIEALPKKRRRLKAGGT